MTLSISESSITFVTRSRLERGTRIVLRYVVRVSSARSEVECEGPVERVRNAAGKLAPHSYRVAVESHRFIKLRA